MHGKKKCSAWSNINAIHMRAKFSENISMVIWKRTFLLGKKTKQFLKLKYLERNFRILSTIPISLIKQEQYPSPVKAQ